MQLIDGIKLKGKPADIPNSSRDELPQFFLDLGFKTGAEIGVYKGGFCEKFCKVGIKMFAIDPWIAFKGAGRTQRDQNRQDFLYGHTQRVLNPYKNVEIIRKASMDAVETFEDNSLDFVYIDGDHRFRFVADDIYEWYSKVKKGGVISGHDYYCTKPGANNLICEVKTVVDAFVETFGIENFYTFGRSKPLEEEKRDDRYLSWMFFKP